LKGKADLVIAKTLDHAVAEAARDAEASGLGSPVVLLSPACASYDQYPNFEVRGDAFRNLVRKLPGVVVPRGLEPSQQF
jgi:UDP-N-acetylmuramoylalanine--D-glutamate ligase